MDSVRSRAPVPFAVLSQRFLQMMLKGRTLTRLDFFKAGAVPQDVIAYIRNTLYVPVRTLWPDPHGLVEWSIREEEADAYRDPVLRKKQREAMQKQAQLRKMKNEAQRDIKALRKEGHPIPERLKQRAAWPTIRATEGTSKYEV